MKYSISVLRTGKSTGAILKTLSDAILNRNKSYYYTDHAQFEAPDATRFHLRTFQEFIKALGLKDIEVSLVSKSRIKVVSKHKGIIFNKNTGELKNE